MMRNVGPAFLLLICGWAPAQATEQHSRAVMQELRAQDYQTDLPGVETMSGAAADNGKPGAPPRRPPYRPGGAGTAQIPETSHPLAVIARLLLWILLGVVVVVTAIWLTNSYLLRTLPAGTSAETSRQRPEDTGTGPEHADQQLVHDVRKLLRQALRLLSEHRLLELAPALTGREALRRAHLGGEARECLELLVRAVETSAFGGLGLTPGERLASQTSIGRLATYIDNQGTAGGT